MYIYWVFHVDRELITNTDKDYTTASKPFHSDDLNTHSPHRLPYTSYNFISREFIMEIELSGVQFGLRSYAWF